MKRFLTIGGLARRSGVSVRTLRFWSDEGLLPVHERSRSGYRLYDAEALARVELVVTLRELGFGHDAIERVLRDRSSVAEVAGAHVRALEHRIRQLQRQRSVLRVVARRGAGLEEMKIMHALAKLTAAERQALLDELVDRAFEGIPDDAPGARIGQLMRTLPPDLPDDPTDAQLDAWIGLAELASDESFVARVRQMAVEGARQAGPGAPPELHERVMKHAPKALADGVDPASSAADAVIDAMLPSELALDRRALRETLERFTDPRVERYWSLLGTLHGRPPAPSMVAPYAWLIAVLRARE